MDEIDAARDRFSRKLQVAFALHRDGVDLMRQNLRRRHPDESDEEVDARLRLWLRDRPADTPGRLVSWPDRKPPAEEAQGPGLLFPAHNQRVEPFRQLHQTGPCAGMQRRRRV